MPLFIKASLNTMYRVARARKTQGRHKDGKDMGERTKV
jgi:hypothetical protein